MQMFSKVRASSCLPHVNAATKAGHERVNFWF